MLLNIAPNTVLYAPINKGKITSKIKNMEKLNVINLSSKSFYYENEWISPKYLIDGNSEYYSNSSMLSLNYKFYDILNAFFKLGRQLSKYRDKPVYFIFDSVTDKVLKNEIISRFVSAYDRYRYIDADTMQIFGRVWDEEIHIIKCIDEYEEKTFIELT